MWNSTLFLFVSRAGFCHFDYTHQCINLLVFLPFMGCFGRWKKIILRFTHFSGQYNRFFGLKESHFQSVCEKKAIFFIENSSENKTRIFCRRTITIIRFQWTSRRIWVLWKWKDKKQDEQKSIEFYWDIFPPQRTQWGKKIYVRMVCDCEDSMHRQMHIVWHPEN